jgi:hypothetical protein
MVILRHTADRALFGKADTRPPPCAAAFRLIDRRILVDRFRRFPEVFGGARDQRWQPPPDRQADTSRTARDERGFGP